MKALAWKELREVFIIVAAALAWYLAVTVNAMGAKAFNWMPLMPQGTHGIPFVHDGEFAGVHSLISGIFAVVLGFRQSAWESSRGTYLFLLHRPIRRETVFLIKLAMGSAVYLLCASLPILLYTWWAFLPGHHTGPFEWSMTGAAWRMTFLMLLLYLGAFLSGLRSARWFGTRLLPLAGSVMLLVLGNTLPESKWWYLGFPLALALCAVLISNIFFVARVRDYA
jgi:ABC-type transport system involved in multi-copper enzyme maturation permease subunit